jgi:catechol 2,3-dioxygenase-like lactoylglutathione lyase family enzyme
MTSTNLGGIERRTVIGSVVAGLTLIGAMAGIRRARAADQPTPIPSPRLGLAVADLQKSVDFYVNALGFKEIGGAQSVGKLLATAMETDSPLNVRFVEKNGLAIELLHFAENKKPVPHPMDQRGLTNLTVAVDNLEAVSALVKQHGGTIIEKTRTKFGAPGNGALIVFCEDPDGVRIGLEQVI